MGLVALRQPRLGTQYRGSDGGKVLVWLLSCGNATWWRGMLMWYSHRSVDGGNEA